MSHPLSDHTPVTCPHRAVVREIVAVRPEIRIIRLEPEAPFTFRAGQYVYAGFGGFSPRPYSLAAAPGGLLEIHIKRGTGPASRHATESLRSGDALFLSAAMGESILGESEAAPVLALAGGLGVAPIKAIIEQALQRAAPPPAITLLWAAEKHDDLYLDDYFRSVAVQNDVFSYKPVSDQLITGALATHPDDIAASRVFVSGPPAMITAVLPLLHARGVPEEKITYDRHP